MLSVTRPKLVQYVSYVGIRSLSTISNPKFSTVIQDSTPRSGNLLDEIKTSGSVGLRRYLTIVGTKTTQSVLTIAAVGGLSALSTMYLPTELLAFGYCGGFAVSMVSIFKMNGCTPLKIERDNVGPYPTNSQDREFWFNTFNVSFGMTIAPSILVAPQLAIPVFVGAAAVTGSTFLASLMMPRDSMIGYGNVLIGGLFGLCSLGIANIFIDSSLLHNVNIYGGLGLFMLLNMYDTHLCIREYEKGQLDHYAHAMNYSLNFWNIFVRLMEIARHLKD